MQPQLTSNTANLLARQQQLTTWLCEQLSVPHIQLASLTGDAGFRRYFRFQIEVSNPTKLHSYIAVDAPNAGCNNPAFLAIQQLLKTNHINVPNIIAENLTQGFFCLTDLGDQLLATNLTPNNVALYYQQALTVSLNIAQIKPNKTLAIPIFDASFVQRELTIFVEWLLDQHLKITLSVAQQQQLQRCFELLINNIIEQPQVFMHRDFHSRNIMLTEGQLAVLDFQDAVIGPITYDVVSLLRDCYVRWPAPLVSSLFNSHYQQLSARFALPDISHAQWQRWFDLTGLQRHIKAAGIFARLFHRDGKSQYLADIPLTLQYIVDISAQYPELSFIHQLVIEQVIPALPSLPTDNHE